MLEFIHSLLTTIYSLCLLISIIQLSLISISSSLYLYFYILFLFSFILFISLLLVSNFIPLISHFHVLIPFIFFSIFKNPSHIFIIFIYKTQTSSHTNLLLNHISMPHLSISFSISKQFDIYLVIHSLQYHVIIFFYFFTLIILFIYFSHFHFALSLLFIFHYVMITIFRIFVLIRSFLILTGLFHYCLLIKCLKTDDNLLIDYCRYLLMNSLLYVEHVPSMIHILIAYENSLVLLSFNLMVLQIMNHPMVLV